MEKWSFNYQLFSRLSDVLDITGTEIARRCGLRQQVLSRYTTNEIVVSVQVLIKLCNSIRMPFHYFIAEDGNCIIPNRESATIPFEYWQPIEWDTQAVEHTFGDGEGRIYWKDVATVMGVSEQKPHERFTLRRRFRITDFLATCSHYDISPYKFLIDRNRDFDKRQKTKPQYRGDDSLIAKIAELSRKMSDLTDTVNRLSDKYDALLKAHEQLAHRAHVNIDTISGGYIGNIGIAADPVTQPDDD